MCSGRTTIRSRRSGRSTSQRPCAATLKQWDTPSSRLLYRLVPSERPTGGTGYSLLPTPNVVEVNHPKRVAELKATGRPLHSRLPGEKEKRQTGITDWLNYHGLLPTPTARDWKGESADAPSEGACFVRKSGVKWRMGMSGMAVKNMLPTPTAQDFRRRGPNSRQRGLPEAFPAEGAKRTGATSQLNPLFVEEMMGFPPGWTYFPFLTDDGGENQSRPTETP